MTALRGSWAFTTCEYALFIYITFIYIISMQFRHIGFVEHNYTTSVQKIRWIFKFRGLCTFDFFSYVGTLVPNVWNVEIGIRWVYCKSKKCLQVVQALHRRSRRGEWRHLPWMAQHVNNRCKHRSSEGNCYGESSNHYKRSCWGCRHIGWLMPCNFFKYLESEACGSEVRSKIAEIWPKNPSHDHRSGNVEWRPRRSRSA